MGGGHALLFQEVLARMLRPAIKDHVPAAFTQAKLEPLKDVTSLEEVQKSLDATGLVLGSQTLQWDVQGPATVAATGAVK